MEHPPEMVDMWVKKKKEITFPLNFFKVHMTAYSKNYNIVL